MGSCRHLIDEIVFCETELVPLIAQIDKVLAILDEKCFALAECRDGYSGQTSRAGLFTSSDGRQILHEKMDLFNSFADGLRK